METMNTNRRKWLRSPFRSRVAVKTDKAIYFMESWNISAGGAYIESEIQIPIGTECTLVPFVDECANIFEARGTVVRTVEAGRRYGIGIRFDELASSDMEILDGIVRDWEQSLPEIDLNELSRNQLAKTS